MENETKIEINESTTVPLFNVLVASVALVGGIFWLSSVSFTTTATAGDLKDFKTEYYHDKKEDRETFKQMAEALAYLKAREELREKQNK